MNINHILVPTDLSPCSLYALRAATDLALKLGCKVTLASVVEAQIVAHASLPFAPVVDLGAEHTAAVQNGLGALVAKLPAQLEPSFVIRHGDPAHEIIDLARELKADLVIMGTHGRTGLARALIGSTAEKVVRLSPVPVLTMHEESEPPRAGTTAA